MGNSSSLQDQRSVFDLFFDLIYLRDIELTVINEIFYEFAKDRIALLILFFFLMSNLMPQVFKRNSIENKILFDTFEDQQNIIHVKTPESRRSLVLDKENPKGLLKF